MGGRAFIPRSAHTPEFQAYLAERDARRAKFGGYDTRQEQVTAAFVTVGENVVAFLAFIFIFGTLGAFGLGLAYSLVVWVASWFGVTLPYLTTE